LLPVLILAYKRYDLLEQIFNSLRKYKPKDLFIAVDGPKGLQDVEACTRVKAYVLDLIDWDCTLHTLFRSENLGCGKAVSSAIDWFFEHVEEGIILEEDCLPALDFYSYCERMLEMYRDELNVKHISGCNFVGGLNSKSSFGFSKFASIWGWATWKRAWKEYQFELPFKELIEFKERILPFCSNDFNQLFFWTKGYEHSCTMAYDSWDFQWQISIWLHKGVCIYPTRNLIKNIGFHQDALHTKNISSPLANLPLESFSAKGLKKQVIVLDREFDDFIFYYVHKELFDTPRGKIKKLKIAIEPSLFQKIIDRKYTLRDKLYLLRSYCKLKKNSIKFRW
jgi:hypothetical protein